jgi:hypothetical protein
MNPVEERVRQEAEERIARKVSRGNRTVKRLSTPVAVLTNQSDPPEQKPATNGASPAVPVVLDHSLASAVKPSLRTISKALLRGIKKAEQSGKPVPRLPAGQRWKRRLPKVCW